MNGVRSESVEGILNETTNTIHKHDPGRWDLQTRCRLTYHVSRDQLRLTSIERAETVRDASKCGRCFDEAGGY